MSAIPQRRAKHIGIIGSSGEAATLCYRAIGVEAASAMAEYVHPEVSLHNHVPVDYVRLVREQNWEGVAQLLLSSAEKLARAGAQVLICPDDTVHRAFSLLEARSPVPCLDSAAEVAREACARGYRSLAFLGTRVALESPLYAQQLKLANIEHRAPSLEEGSEIDAIIAGELRHGKLTARSRQRIGELVARLASDQRCDALVLGCTELSLILAWDRAPLPVIDSTRLLARAALRAALE
ncbi:MAG TPA: amino acid racemase [Polyangiales bacterium]|nr:amino acid racemase [Polyangiales bacterium]